MRGLRRPGPGRALPGAGEVAPGRGRHLPGLPLPGLALREVLHGPFAPGRAVPRAPLLLLEVLVLPAVPAARSVLPALALVHGERVYVIHHASTHSSGPGIAHTRNTGLGIRYAGRTVRGWCFGGEVSATGVRTGSRERRHAGWGEVAVLR